MIDSSAYPSAAQYLQSLPSGLNSHPECRVKSDIHLDLVDELADLKSDASLPLEVLRFIRGEHHETWMSEALACTLLHLVRDSKFKNKQDFLDWDFNRNIRTFDKPMYKVLLKVFSTSLLVMGASKRWVAFHEGTTLKAGKFVEEGGIVKNAATLSFPEHLFDMLIIELYAGAYKAALHGVKAPEYSLEIRDLTASSAIFEASWKA